MNRKGIAQEQKPGKENDILYGILLFTLALISSKREETLRGNMGTEKLRDEKKTNLP
jgi:hypothetical protein